MIVPPLHDPAQRRVAVERQIAEEIARIVEDLDFRREFLREIWSVSRDRGGFLDSIETRWQVLSADDLIELDPQMVWKMDGFYRALSDFQLYLRFTDDMPTTLLQRYDRALDRLRDLGADVIEGLGGAPERPMVEFADATVHQHVRSLFAAPRRPPPPASDADEDPADWAAQTAAALDHLYEED